MPDQKPESSPLSPHVAKRQFRALLPMFAAYWQEAAIAPQANEYWRPYLSLLRACQDVLDHAPMHPNEARQANIERRYEKALERLATMFDTILPGGLRELGEYVITEEIREMRRARGLASYRRKQRERRKRRRQ